MGFQKGYDPRRATGRPKGAVNHYTKQVKEAFGLLLEGNLDNLSTWLAQVAADDPKAALDIMMRMSERFVPKLSQQALTDAEGESLLKGIKFQFGPPIDSDERVDEDPKTGDIFDLD